jgi:hypothetical protein
MGLALARDRDRSGGAIAHEFSDDPLAADAPASRRLDDGEKKSMTLGK